MIDQFTSVYSFLSNFYPCIVTFEGIVYPTSEHAFQAAKVLDQATRRRIALAKTPAEAKRMGRAAKLRPDWESVKISIMRQILQEKFKDPDLRRRLQETGSEQLVEGNTWRDTFWGQVDGKGKNWLGKLLMEIRDAKDV